jgi:indole-3-glycerol phosphate synthase
MNDFLAEAVAESRRRVAGWKAEKLLDRLRCVGLPVLSPTSFTDSLRNAGHLGIIAEFKRASPSRGAIRQTLEPATQAAEYAKGGAAAISVLTESRWFQGDIEDLSSVRKAIQQPILRKDFLVEDDDIALSRLIGADAVLLIVACVPSPRLAELIKQTRNLGMTPLVEVHNRTELGAALSAGADVIGVNARNLQTLEVDIVHALDVCKQVPSHCVRILESGIKSRRDVLAAMDAGADAILVGETLMRSEQPGALIQSWLADARCLRQGSQTT